MLCPKCGSNSGDQIRLCPKCAEAEQAEHDAEVAIAEADAQQSSAAHESFEHDFSDAPYAGFWLRFCAYTIDALIVSIPTWMFMLLLGPMFAAVVQHIPVNSASSLGFLMGIILLLLVEMLAVFLVLSVLSVIYFVGFESSKFSATPGKMFVGLVVTDFDGNRISLGRSLARNFSKLFSTILLLIGYAMAGFTQHKQALHDMIAGTLVVRRQIKPLGPIVAVTIFSLVFLFFGNSIMGKTKIEKGNKQGVIISNTGPTSQSPFAQKPPSNQVPATPVPTPTVPQFSGPHVHVESLITKVNAQSIIGFYYPDGGSASIGVYADKLTDKELAHIRSVGSLTTTLSGQVPILTINLDLGTTEGSANSAAKNYILNFRRDPASSFDYSLESPMVSFNHPVRTSGSDLFEVVGTPKAGEKIQLKLRGEGAPKFNPKARFGWDIEQEVELLEPK